MPCIPEQRAFPPWGTAPAQYVTSGRIRTGGDLVIGSCGRCNGNDGAAKVGCDLRGTGTFNAGYRTVVLTDGWLGPSACVARSFVSLLSNVQMGAAAARADSLPGLSELACWCWLWWLLI